MGWDTQVPNEIGQSNVAQMGSALKSGTTAENDAYTGAIGELTYDSDLNEVRAHDGSTAGGVILGGELAVTDRLPMVAEATYAAGLATVASLGVPVKVVAVTTAKGASNGWTIGTDNTFTATFTDTRIVRVQGRFDVDVAAGTDNLTLHVFVGGASAFETAAQSVAAATLVQFEIDVFLEVANGEAIEIYAENEDTTENITTAAFSEALDVVPSHGWVKISG